MSLAVEQLEPGVLATDTARTRCKYFALCAIRRAMYTHNVVEYNVTVPVEGAIETRFAHIHILPAPPNSSRTAIFLVPRVSQAIPKGTIAS